jgi:hypothetical protein
MFRRMATSAVITGLVSALLVALPATEASAVSWKPHTKSYSKTSKFYFKPLKRCIRTTLTGKVSFKFAKISGGKSGTRYTYKDIKIVNPKMVVKVLTKCKGGKAAKLSKAQLTQRWYESRKCSLNVGVAAGYPWGVTLIPTKECGKRKAGVLKTTYSPNKSKYTQYNTGRPLYFKGRLQINKPINKKVDTRLCISGRPTVTAYVGGKSDSWTGTKRMCFKP